ncbi:hypothetical protein MnTg01_01278 [archaeon MnTg01]|nr:hypothetical protein MnTg01_01278 [archaeon MnTg01]
MEIKNILIIGSIVIIILGLSLILIPTEIGMTLVGVILLAVGILLGVTYFVNKGPPK